MKYLLDTNVVSEPFKARPHDNVIRWLAAADEESLFLSVITIAEIRKGIEDMASGRRRDDLTNWLIEYLGVRFDRRILDVGLSVALVWGEMMSRSEKLGINLGALDAFFAATAEVHNLTLVTRNIRDFERLSIHLVNPWEEAS